MNILNRLDAWLGKTLFHPPIILLCQITRQSQYAIYRALWFMAACHATYYASREGIGWGWLVFIWGYTIVAFINATRFADNEVKSWGGFRFIIWTFLTIGILASMIDVVGFVSTIRSAIILFAEYAATIKTIPPRKTREKRATGKAVFHGQ